MAIFYNINGANKRVKRLKRNLKTKVVKYKYE